MIDAKLNVLALVQLPPPIHGAALRNKDLVNSDIFNATCNVLVIPIQTANEIEDIGLFNLGKLFSLARMVYSTLKTLIFSKVDVCYITLSANGFAFYKDLFLIFLAKLFGKNVVCHMRNRGLDINVAKLNFLSKIISTSILKKCRYICMSNSLATDVSSVCINPKVISNCLTRNTDFLNEAIFLQRFSSKSIVYLSNIAESKGALLFLDIVSAVNSLSQKKHGKCIFNFKVYGPFFSPQEEDKFKSKMTALNLVNVEVMGPIYGEEKFSVLRESALMLFPTKYEKECFPGVIMEAFSCSLPVLSRSVAAVPEIISNGVNGFYFYDDPTQYAESILSIFSDKDSYLNLCHGAAESYEKSMRYQVVHEKIYKYLKSVAE
jgi:glycosyltransferase involved in cell wall biosynthesis